MNYMYIHQIFQSKIIAIELLTIGIVNDMVSTEHTP